jgi:hypothetical protein
MTYPEFSMKKGTLVPKQLTNGILGPAQLPHLEEHQGRARVASLSMIWSSLTCFGTNVIYLFNGG